MKGYVLYLIIIVHIKKLYKMHEKCIKNIFKALINRYLSIYCLLVLPTLVLGQHL